MIKLHSYTGTFEVPKEWLLNKIGKTTIDDFLNTYTWDESQWLYMEYSIDQEEIKINNFIQLLKDGKTFFRRGKLEGIFHLCTYKNYKYQFTYFDGYGPVGDFQRNSIEEMAKSIAEYGFEPCSKYDLRFIK